MKSTSEAYSGMIKMELEKLTNEKLLTQEGICSRLDTVSDSIASYLSKRGIDINYNPETRTIRNWYGRTLHVDFCAKSAYFANNCNLFNNRININILTGTKLAPKRLHSDGEIVDMLLHEKTHQDIGIIETPLACLGVITFAVLTKCLWKTAALTAGYVLLREFVVDGIKRVKYGKIKSEH